MDLRALEKSENTSSESLYELATIKGGMDSSSIPENALFMRPVTHVAVSSPKRVREKGKNRVIFTLMFEEFRSIVRDFSC